MYIALHHFTEDKNMAQKNENFSPSRRKFIKEGAAIGVGATAFAGAAAQAQVRWDRTADVVRMWADENVATFEFLIENGVKFNDEKPDFVNGGTVPRLCVAQVFSPDLNETINGRAGSGIVRPLEKSARGKGAEILLKHRMTRIIRENATSGRVLGVTARFENKDVNIRARKGVVIATGGHT